MLMHVIVNCTHRVCTDTVRVSALAIDSGRKIPSRTEDLNLHQYYSWLFSQTLYQLSYPGPWPNFTSGDREDRGGFLVCDWPVL